MVAAALVAELGAEQGYVVEMANVDEVERAAEMANVDEVEKLVEMANADEVERAAEKANMDEVERVAEMVFVAARKGAQLEDLY